MVDVKYNEKDDLAIVFIVPANNSSNFIGLLVSCPSIYPIASDSIREPRGAVIFRFIGLKPL